MKKNILFSKDIWCSISIDDLEIEIDGIYYAEQWKELPEYGGAYQGSNFGRIKTMGNRYNGNKVQILSPQIDKDGYVVVNLYNKDGMKTKKVHRITGALFVDNPEGKNIINHKDGIKCNNFYKNLEWNTISENTLHGYRVLNRKRPKGGLGRFGSLNGNATAVYCPTLGISFGGIGEASRQLGVWKNGITEVLEGKRIHVKGLTFQYK